MTNEEIVNGENASARTRRFEAAMLPHLGAAYNLARWLLHDDHAAQDAVQDAYLRALKYFDRLCGDDARPWLLGIVRNTCFTWLKDNRLAGEQLEFDEERDSNTEQLAIQRTEDNPERLLMQKMESALINQAIGDLPPVYREVIILRELEALSYEEIALVVAVPIGTVMSRLARARAILRSALKQAE
ncbi:MAG: sigma-70 family RNA polymerase sigma factor [Gallionellaceae bacterium]|jgi:RNA polymerase sigma factor (sigma-70 family)